MNHGVTEKVPSGEISWCSYQSRNDNNIITPNRRGNVFWRDSTPEGWAV